jgi:invasion protein IalB
MTSRKTLLAAAVFGGASAMLAAGALPAFAQQQQPPQGWFKVCAKQEDNDICNTQNIKTADTGQLMTAVNLIEIKGKVNRKVFQIAVPTGRLIPPGIGMQIDNGKTIKVNYSVCFPNRCIAETALTDELVNALKKGGDVTFTSVNFQNKQNPIKISLTGFTDAYTGPGMQQSDIQKRQQELQQEIQKRRADFEKKLKEEQDKAKSGN